MGRAPGTSATWRRSRRRGTDRSNSADRAPAAGMPLLPARHRPAQGVPGLVTIRVWPGSPYPQGATWDGKGSTSRCSPSTPPASTSCLFERPDDAVEAERIPLTNRTTRCGTPTCRTCDRDACTATACTDRTSHGRATGSTRTSSSSIRTRGRSADRFDGTTRSTATRSATRTGTSPSTRATAQVRCRSAWSSTGRSPGERTVDPRRRGTGRSSTRRTCGA